jgi:hypothetical protein
VFLYRQALELYLKSIVCADAKLSNLTFDQKDYEGFASRHNLDVLVGPVLKIAARRFASGDESDAMLDHLDIVCRDFNELDPASYAYRYPTKKSGHSATKPHQVVNLGDFVRGMNSALDTLDAIDTALKVSTDSASDALSHLQALVDRLRPERGSTR